MIKTGVYVQNSNGEKAFVGDTVRLNLANGDVCLGEIQYIDLTTGGVCIEMSYKLHFKKNIRDFEIV